MKRIVCPVISLLCFVSNSAFAQWGPTPTESQWAKPSQPSQPTRDNNGNPIQYDSQGRPIERRLDNNGNPITPDRDSTNSPLPQPVASQGTVTKSGTTTGQPPCYMELPFLKEHMNVSGRYPGVCIGGKYHGQAIIALDDPNNPNFIPMEYTVNVRDGKVFGIGIISIGNGAVTYTGTFKNYQPWDGTNVAYDERGNSVRDGYLRGQYVPFAQAPKPVAYVPYVPPKEQAVSTARPSDGERCFTERPTDRYFVTGKFPGECRGGRYNGTAELTLSPKDPHDPIVKLTATYTDGSLSGPVKAIYPQYALTYRGTFDGFVAGTGRAEQPLGDRTFDITEYQNGQIVSSRTEYRPPSEFEQALIAAAGRFGERLGTQLGREIDGSAERARDQRRQAEAARRQQDIARAPDITKQPTVDTYTQQQEAARIDRERVIEDARQKQLAGLDRDGNPLPAPAAPVQVARSDPQPVFTADTNPPATPTVTTNPPVFGGNTNPQGDPPIITTQPPELPAPHPAAPSLPDPVRGGEPFGPPVPAPVRVADLPPPSTPSPDGSPPPIAPPVQLGNQNDTLGTGPAPSNPVPSPQPLDTPVTPSQPVVPATGRPVATPASSSQTIGSGIPHVPTGLYPTNPGELAQPIPLGWSAVSGATRYRLTVKNQTTGGFPVDDIYVAGNGYTVRDLPAGTDFTWDVAACNQAGCSARSVNGIFRTGGGVRTDTCRIEVRFKPLFHISNHAFIVTSDSNSITYFRGGPESRESVLSDRLLRDVSNFVFGRIVTETGSYSSGTPDWISTPSGSQTVAILQSNCDDIDRRFGRYLADIEWASTTYNPLYKNSNSVIREVLERAGYGYVAPVVTATAWNSQLP